MPPGCETACWPGSLQPGWTPSARRGYLPRPAGHASLDDLGTMAAGPSARNCGIGESSPVSPFSTWPLASKRSRARDPVRTLAEATGAGSVVSSELNLQGQTIQVRTTITDEMANKPLYAEQAANGPREHAMQLAESCRQRVNDAVAVRYLNPDLNLQAEEAKPPRFEAQKEFAAYDELIVSDLGTAIAPCNRPLELGPYSDRGKLIARHVVALPGQVSRVGGVAGQHRESTPAAQSPHAAPAGSLASGCGSAGGMRLTALPTIS